ncbi:hypothetical protein LCGC14_2326650 [marine sediment metagenome]|uniref:Alcohol dehydrogenase-like N-terminal domain-containing protein n=1 Tax=marine sediment metagenome TaxID=412755 RepID=A0A0F9CGV6_9ZZZZ
MTTMKALVKKQAAEGLWLEEAPIPEFGINDVFIKVLRTAICGTDLHIYNWNAWARKTIPVPMVVGHEFVGEVVSVGDNNYDNGEAATIDANVGQYYQEFVGNYTGAYGPGSPTDRFYPTPGNHDYLTTDAQPYYDYFT